MKKLMTGLFLMVTVTLSAVAAEVLVAVASNFGAPMQKIVQSFEQETGHKAVLALGSTGHFYTHIMHGAPYDVLLAADSATPLKIEQQGKAVVGSRFTYATGKLVLWSLQPGRVDPQGDILRRGQFQRIAMANPKLAPYGAAAIETLGRMGILNEVQRKRVQGENIAQAYQFVATGNADLGFVALSQVMTDGKLHSGSAWVVPADWYSPIRQDAILLTPGQSNAAAHALLKFLRTEKVKTLIHSFGYEL
jgi:molybdate transport system substrate-binding protein